MNTIRDHIRKLQFIESDAADKTGMRFRLIDRKRLLKKNREKYIREIIKLVEIDITPEIMKSVKMGIELYKRVAK